MRFLLVFMCVALSWAQSEWKHTVSPSKTAQILRDAQGTSWFVTNGGVYRWTATDLRQFTSSDGLPSADIAALVSGKQGVFAISRDGKIAQLVSGQDRFVTQHTAYASTGWSVLDGGVLAKGRYLAIAMDKGLVFYDVESRRSVLTLRRIAQTDLSSQPIRSILWDDLGLVVVTDSIAYGVQLDTLDFNKDATGKSLNLSDPSVWKVVPMAGSLPVRWAMRDQDTLRVHNRLGTLVDQQTWVYEGQLPKMKGQVWQDTVYFKTDTSAKMRFLIPLGADSARWLLGGTEGAYLNCDTKGVCSPIQLNQVPAVVWHDLIPTADGVLARSVGEVWSWGVQKGWSRQFGVANLGYSSEYFDRALRITEPWQGGVALGTWGQGLIVRDSLGGEKRYENGTSCLGAAVPGFTAISSVSLGQGALWATYWVGGSQYGVFRLGADGQTQCWNGIGSDPSSASAQWFGDTLWVAHATGLDALRLVDGSLELVRTYPSPSGGLIGLAKDGLNRTWAIGQRQLMIVCGGSPIVGVCQLQDRDSLRSAVTALGLESVQFTDLHGDAAGQLWLGTMGQGAYRLKPAEQISPSQLKNWTTSAGLASNDLLSLRPDDQKGQVWAAHPRGVSVLQTGVLSVQERQKIEPILFPNPYRMQVGGLLKLRALPSGSRIILLSPAGEVLGRWASISTMGGVWELDLKAQYPQLAPGAYRLFVLSNQGEQRFSLAVTP